MNELEIIKAPIKEDLTYFENEFKQALNSDVKLINSISGFDFKAYLCSGSISSISLSNNLSIFTYVLLGPSMPQFLQANSLLHIHFEQDNL